MKWPWQKHKEPQETEEPVRGIRREEIADIIDRMPMSFGKWVAGSVVLFAALFLLFGWLIKYPDTISGEIQISASHAPVKLIAYSSGKIHLLKNQTQVQVKEGEYIAVIQNSASTEDVKKIADLLKNFNPNETESNTQSIFPEKISLGDMDTKYYTFLSVLRTLRRFNEKNNYSEEINTIRTLIQSQNELLKETQETYEITLEKLKLSKKWYKRYEGMDQKIVGTYEQEVDNTKSEYLSAQQSEKTLKKEILSIQMQINENHHKLEQLELEKEEKQKQLQLELLASFHSLKDNLVAWENQFVFKAPFAGTLEFLNFLNENQFVQSGQEVFALVPKENKVTGKMYLPATGAGKVDKNSRLKIKLQDYPYNEFGSIEGRVSAISLVTTDLKMTQGTSKNYLISVTLPKGLVTNFGEQLPFKHDMVGEADIIVKERRLIERLFDNLKQNTK